MHRLPTKSAIFRFRLSAILFLLLWISIPATLGVTAYLLVANRRELLPVSGGLLALSLILGVMQWIVASRARCPLCMMPSLAKKACSKNRNAKRLLGSYRLKASTSILLQGNFRCPYCNEPTVLQVRKRS